MRELDGATGNRSPSRGVEILRQVTDLLLQDSNRFSEPQIGVFDEGHARILHLRRLPGETEIFREMVERA